MTFKEHNTSNISSTLETLQYNINGNKDYIYDQKYNYSFDSDSNLNIFKDSEEMMPDNKTLPEKSLLNKQVDEPFKSKFSNQKDKDQNKDESSDIRKIKQQKNKTKKKTEGDTFLITKTYYLKSGNTTIKRSHRSSNYKNRILRNLIQDIFIDWISRQNNKRINIKKIRKLKKLDSKYLEFIYKNYMNMKKFKLKEIYSGDCFGGILAKDKDKYIFEFNKKAIREYEFMEPKTNCTFKEAFNYFYNKENIISSQDGDLLNGLKSKNEYINEKDEKKDLEKFMKVLFDNINH